MSEAGSLAQLRTALAPAIAEAAAFDGWSVAAVIAAAEAQGASRDAALYAFADGAMAMIEALAGWVDERMVAGLPAGDLAALKVRERIARQILFRLDCLAGREEAMRRAAAIMAMPHHAAAALRLGWRSADLIWRQAGDRASDFNHYTKRATLAAIYGATLAVWIDDTSEAKGETRAFLERRIDGVMRFEKAKSRLTLPANGNHFSPVRLLGRLRYPAR